MFVVEQTMVMASCLLVDVILPMCGFLKPGVKEKEAFPNSFKQSIPDEYAIIKVSFMSARF